MVGLFRCVPMVKCPTNYYASMTREEVVCLVIGYGLLYLYAWYFGDAADILTSNPGTPYIWIEPSPEALHAAVGPANERWWRERACRLIRGVVGDCVGLGPVNGQYRCCFLDWCLILVEMLRTDVRHRVFTPDYRQRGYRVAWKTRKRLDIIFFLMGFWRSTPCYLSSICMFSL